jgi:hypothetical protein
VRRFLSGGRRKKKNEETNLFYFGKPANGSGKGAKFPNSA